MNVRRLLKLLIYFVLFLLALIAGVLVKAAGNNEFLPLVVHLPNSTALPVLTPTPTITPTPGPLNTGEITRVSVATDGTAGNMRSGSSDISSDGRYVVFSSYATNLVPNDTNGAFDIFIHDKETLETSLVSVSSSGAQGGNDSTNPSISSDGRFVAFSSYAYNLVPDNWDIAPDVYVHDRETGETSRVSVSSDGVGGNDWSVLPSISVDGTLVAFASLSNNLVIDDDNGNWDIFVHDRLTQQTSLVSVSTGGVQGNAASINPAISGDGRYVTFQSFAGNLVSGDTNDRSDIFVHEILTGITQGVSVTSGGVTGNGHSVNHSISVDGRYVVFDSVSDDLVPGDFNEDYDIFVRDLVTEQTVLVSVNSQGLQANDRSQDPFISEDGRFVAFSSWASNLIDSDTNQGFDIFVHDLLTAKTSIVSVSSEGLLGNSWSSEPSMDASGRYVTFSSWADNLVLDDTNLTTDVFVYDREE